MNENTNHDEDVMDITEEADNHKEVKNDEMDEIVDDQVDNEVEEISDSETDNGIESMDELSQIREVNEELEDKVLRLQAEIANMSRSSSRERHDLLKYRSQSLAAKLLDVIDNLERALETDVTSDDGLALKKGVEMVHSQFLQAFEQENIQVLNPLNEEFDPNFHQAVTTAPVDDEHPENTVVQVLQKGYCIDTRVIRPAMVIVAQ